MARGSGVVLRDVLDIKEDVLSGDFKIALSEGFTGDAAGSIDDYVVTPQLQGEFRKALKLVGSALRKNASHAAYLHGSFGAGKSHFLTVLHAVLNGDPAVESKTRLREVVTEHADWLPGRKFLMVPYHLVGAASLESALLGGYVKAVRRERPEAPTPLVFRADSLLADARELRAKIGDEAFIGLLPAPVAPRAAAADDEDGEHDEDDEDGELPPIGAVPAVGWTSAALDAAFRAPAGDPQRDQLLTALFNGPNKHYADTVSGDAAAYVTLDDGLSEMSKHARSLGYDGVVLFLDELVLWLQARMSNRTFINDEIQKLSKLIESSNPDRPVPILSFISRQRDLSQLMGSDILGSDVENLQQALEYLKERVTVVDLEDRNLPEIIKERVLRPLPGQERVLEAAFTGIDKAGQLVKDVLLDGEGATGADWEDFRAVYPLSPALLNVLVALSGALQRERTGLKLVQQLLERNADAEVGRLIPLGDLWDVLVDATSTAFTAKLQQESETARRFYAKARRYLLNRYGRADHPDFLADERYVKTLLLAALAPDVPALRRLTAGRLAALNHGSLRSRAVPVREKVIERMRALQGAFPGELRSEGTDDPVFSLHLSDLDVEPILDAVVGEDKGGARRAWLRERLWEELGLTGRQGQLLDEKKIVWRGSERTVEFVFGEVRNARSVADEAFEPATAGNLRIILDCPFDEEPGRSPDDAYRRVAGLRASHPGAPVLVWLCDHFSEQRKAQLGRLMRINFLLERDRLSDYTRTFPPDDRLKARRSLEHARDNLTRTLVESLREVYGLAEAKDGTRGAEVADGRHVLSLQPEFPRPQPEGSKPFDLAVAQLADGMFSALYDKHPDFGPGPGTTPRAVTPADLAAALKWLIRAVDEGGRAEVDTKELRAVKRVVEALELGTVHDGPLVVRGDQLRTRINQAASAHGEHGELAVEDIRNWIRDDLGLRGLDKHVSSLLIAAYALFDDRSWVLYSGTETTPPPLSEIGLGWKLRAQQLPTEEEYATARDRAGQLFGVTAKPGLFARNVNRLATDVLARATAYEKSVGDVRTVLKRHAALLGLDGEGTTERGRILREAAALLARLVRHTDDATGLVCELASVSYDTPARELSHAMDSAADVLAALDGTNWRLLTSVHGLTGRDDSIGDRAQRLMDRIGEAARTPEFRRSLIPVLGEVRELGHALVDSALRLERPAPDEPAAEPDPVTDAGQVTLSEHGAPPISSDPAGPVRGEQQPLSWEPEGSGTGADGPRPPRAARRVIAPGPAALHADLSAVREEVEAFRALHPDTPVEISWRAEPDGESR
ncbi:hypothetical protein [Streptomyces rapamycinicus]|uniref:PglY protein n=2 Tax=Streptomyces rapamycinicus TaxID=1226757 RepID=A0A0A0NGT5_STRRN|nr:hypothetical protein [Streptomyces rapamycinicus]AGP55283.1 hypothetical protein M271_18640 [Streptomyces rapamycinicus NRRL 5491]MBB4782831.1 hypothetical protein [Streptomyces rapamycinicus]RLV81689.1 hypothetical protein D3C57_124930 [Streptomyces rapamycinicus NRRL 5491]UTO63300.1 hypothetical protein LJB45_13865 [Streptomyces rapamycinicus]UTP31258.1 hypothetical protein LIV37_18980 [Streptomyces rapamycinicus NRRL 5491]